MIKELFIDFFKEIEIKQFKKNKNSKTDYWANELQEVDFNHENYIGKRKAERYYEKYIEGKKKISVKIPNEYQRDFISKYLGYENYQDYLSKKPKIDIPLSVDGEATNELNDYVEVQKKMNDPDGNLKKIVVNINWKKTVVISLGLLFTLYIAIVTNENHFFNSKDCIVWKVDHYEKASCFTTNALDNSKYKINIDLFKKVTVDTSTVFFTNGISNYWYGKNSQGKRDFFTHRGIHPETKKELKPITRNILKSEGLLN